MAMETLNDFQDVLDALRLTGTEKKLVVDMPSPVAFGYIVAKRKREGIPAVNGEEMFGKGFWGGLFGPQWHA